MATIVSAIASTHNPRIFWNRDQADPTDLAGLYATFDKVRGMLAETKPDLIVGVANDHLDNFFFDQHLIQLLLINFNIFICSN
jgi:hypothetical protein